MPIFTRQTCIQVIDRQPKQRSLVAKLHFSAQYPEVSATCSSISRNSGTLWDLGFLFLELNWIIDIIASNYIRTYRIISEINNANNKVAPAILVRHLVFTGGLNKVNVELECRAFAAVASCTLTLSPSLLDLFGHIWA